MIFKNLSWLGRKIQRECVWGGPLFAPTKLLVGRWMDVCVSVCGAGRKMQPAVWWMVKWLRAGLWQQIKDLLTVQPEMPAL